MSSRLAADRQIRAAAALAAPTLDVRGPVSEALGRAGITVPVAGPPAPEVEPAFGTAPEPTIGRPAAQGLRPTRKPFSPASGPRYPRGAEAEADPISGLTADERRVHRLLLDSLDRTVSSENGGLGGMNYAERKRLGALDLAFINAELAKMAERQTRVAEWGHNGLLATLFVVPLALVLALVAGAAAADVVQLFLVGLAVASAGLLGLSVKTGAASPRRQIYEALRELALLVDDAPVSEALAQADRLIDGLADADEAPRTTRSRTRS